MTHLKIHLKIIQHHRKSQEWPDKNIEETETAPETEARNNENNISQDTNYEQNNAGHSHNTDYEQYDDDISIENEIPERHAHNNKQHEHNTRDECRAIKC